MEEFLWTPWDCSTGKLLEIERKVAAAPAQGCFLPFSPRPVTLKMKNLHGTPPRGQGNQGMTLLVALAIGGPWKMQELQLLQAE